MIAKCNAPLGYFIDVACIFNADNKCVSANAQRECKMCMLLRYISLDELCCSGTVTRPLAIEQISQMMNCGDASIVTMNFFAAAVVAMAIPQLCLLLIALNDNNIQNYFYYYFLK